MSLCHQEIDRKKLKKPLTIGTMILFKNGCYFFGSYTHHFVNENNGWNYLLLSCQYKEMCTVDFCGGKLEDATGYTQKFTKQN